MTMKSMLDTSFPGIHVVLENYPPPFPKRALSKIMPVIQVGAIGTLMAGDQIFPRFGMVPPPWYYSLRANRFGTMASIWLFGNFAQSLLQSSGAFEVYCNGQLVCFCEYTLCCNSLLVIFDCAIIVHLLV
jgi:selT/selW/selH-like putative selenoprotein